MLLRICLIVTILASAGAIVLSHFKVRPHVQEIIDQRESEKSAKVKALAQLKDTTAKLKDTTAKLKETESNLAETKTQLGAAKSQAEAENKRANGLKQELTKTQQDLNDAQQKLNRWAEVPLDPSQVKDLMVSEKNLRAANQALDEEKKFFVKKAAQLDKQLKELLGGDEVDPPMPVGLKGRVLIVDPKWHFVVLDVGEKQGAVPRGVLMVSRNTKLVAKVRIMNVQPDKSIANIMPGWSLSEVMEGDQVLY